MFISGISACCCLIKLAEEKPSSGMCDDRKRLNEIAKINAMAAIIADSLRVELSIDPI
jgi:hypothetical protein